MHHPYQCLATCRPAEDSSSYLLAASGPKLFAISLDDGTIASKWPLTGDNEVAVDDTTDAEPREAPPKKKRRLSSIAKIQLSKPNIIKLTVAPSHEYIVAVTDTDKTIHVFSISPDGILTHLSARAMPKRPCAVAFTPNEKDILSADKFGDVYSLPLLLDPEAEAKFAEEQRVAMEAKMEKDAKGPAATELTVHSKANRRALETQVQQAKDRALNALTKSKSRSKDGGGGGNEMNVFSHKLLLGHVSMLTDMIVTTLRPSEAVETRRTYILTSDRDEHIRVSRGPPQSHIIETYCLAHHEFVSKLCLAEPGLLVSGGGDNELLVWDWLEGKVLNRIDLVEVVKRARIHIRIRRTVPLETREATEAELTEAEAEVVKKVGEGGGRVAVAGLWLFEDSSMKTEPQLLVTVEGVPAVMHIPVASLRSEKAKEDMSFLCLDGNVLDVGLIGDAMIVSTDNIHEAGTTNEIDTREDFTPRLLAFQAIGEELGGGAVFRPYTEVNNALAELNGLHTAEWHEKSLQALLYGVENLRKRGGKDEDAIVE